MRDRTARTEPLTIGQRIVAWWETTTSASEPADLAERIDDATAAEREACAKIAAAPIRSIEAPTHGAWERGYRAGRDEAAAAIRNRK